MKTENSKIDNTNKIPRILLVDMNSFFASVEQQANPSLRGKPLGISNNRREAACLIGTSKEAKAMGIKNGTPLYKARKICPKILVIESEPEKYREVNRQIVEIFKDYTDRVEVYSIDEAFLDLSEKRFTFDGGAARIVKRLTADGTKPLDANRPSIRAALPNNVLEVGAEIKRRIKQEVGEWLTCSVGIAPNKFMAKLAADMQKPDGLSILWREQLPAIYHDKQLTDLWGINHGWRNRLAKLGISSPLQLLDYPVENLISLFGKPGFFIWQRVNGLEEDVIKNSSALDGNETRIVEGQTSDVAALRNGHRNLSTLNDLPKSFGHSWVLNFRTVDKDRLKIVILRLAEKAARRMRREGFVAHSMYLSVTLSDGSFFHRSKKLRFGIETGLELYQEAIQIWKTWNFVHEVMHIAVGFGYLSLKTPQLSLFFDRTSKLTPTLDWINDKYGEFTIRPGLLTNTTDFAPDAIAFGK